MAAFRYRALSPDGREQAGVIEADSGRGARTLLRERGLHPLEVDALSASAAGRAARARLPATELMLLSRQWATLLAAGLTVEQSLGAMIEQSERESTRQLLAGVRAEVLAGHSLHAALDRHAAAFPAIYRASIAAGEQSGELARVMLQLADHLERSGDLRRKTLQALIYPAIVAVVAVLVIASLMIWVVPQVVGVFAQGKQTLPLLTRVMIGTSGFLRDWGWLLLVLVAASGLALAGMLRNESVRRRADRVLLALPLLGRHLRTLDAARFASTLAILVGSGVPLLAALGAGARVVGRLPMRDAIDAATARVREGASLARALGATRAFPPLLVHMVASGEATGRIEALLERAAGLQRQELEVRTATLTSLMEPLLLLVMGGVVLLIVLGVMQPIIEINTLLR